MGEHELTHTGPRGVLARLPAGEVQVLGQGRRVAIGGLDERRLAEQHVRVSRQLDERTGRAIVFGAIDNLWKGTASQALQNLNLMFGRPEGEGIS